MAGQFILIADNPANLDMSKLGTITGHRLDEIAPIVVLAAKDGVRVRMPYIVMIDRHPVELRRGRAPSQS